MSRLVSGLSTRLAMRLASASLRLRKVGGISSPPLTVAATPIAACNGATDRPWPKAMVTVLSSPQCLRHQRLGAFGQFGAQPVELAHLLQERLVAVHADRQRHARGADIRGIGEDLRHREEAVLRLVVVDGEAAVLQRMAGIETRAQRRLAGIERHRDGEHLEGRAHFIDAGGQPVDAGRIVGLARIVGVVVGLRSERDHLAGIDVEHDAGGGLGLEISRAP